MLKPPTGYSILVTEGHWNGKIIELGGILSSKFWSWLPEGTHRKRWGLQGFWLSNMEGTFLYIRWSGKKNTRRFFSHVIDWCISHWTSDYISHDILIIYTLFSTQWHSLARTYLRWSFDLSHILTQNADLIHPIDVSQRVIQWFGLTGFEFLISGWFSPQLTWFFPSRKPGMYGTNIVFLTSWKNCQRASCCRPL